MILLLEIVNLMINVKIKTCVCINIILRLEKIFYIDVLNIRMKLKMIFYIEMVI